MNFDIMLPRRQLDIRKTLWNRPNELKWLPVAPDKAEMIVNRYKDQSAHSRHLYPHYVADIVDAEVFSTPRGYKRYGTVVKVERLDLYVPTADAVHDNKRPRENYELVLSLDVSGN